MIVGKDGKGAIVTLVERKSCFMLMEKLDSGKRAVPLAHAVVRLLKGSGLSVRTITTDNRTEFAAHEIIAKGIGHYGLLCTSILLLGKGRHREHERTCQAVYP